MLYYYKRVIVHNYKCSITNAITNVNTMIKESDIISFTENMGIALNIVMVFFVF